MKYFFLFFCLCGLQIFGQDIRSVQVFNPKTNDETPVIGFNEHLILKFDDLSNSSQIYRYTFRHYNRDWQDDGLFFTEFAAGNLSDLINNFEYSFNTYQKYTHYELAFPNAKMQPKISGNFEIVVYKDSPEKPLFTRRFCVVEEGASMGISVTRFADAQRPMLNQRLEVQMAGQNLMNVANSISLTLIQNNNWEISVSGQRPSATLGNRLMFQQLDLVFPGNNEFYYFDNKNMQQPMDMVRSTENLEGINYTYLYPVWAYPQNYQFQPDVNGAFYFRRNDLGIERDADKEGDYSWVYFSLDSEKTSREIYVLGLFNNYNANKENQMFYDEQAQKYVAKIYLKQGFYNYILAVKESGAELNYGVVNGNFWQTENLYQGFLYYTPFGRNYDGLISYGEFRKPVR